MKIIDCHAHIFPWLDGPAGFGSRAEHMLFLQRIIATHTIQPVRSLRSHAVIGTAGLWDPNDMSPAGKLDVGFHAGSYGRMVWKTEEQERYLQFFAPYMQAPVAPPESMLANMDYVGVSTAILQNDHVYGNLNAYFSSAVSAYPERFVGLAQVNEAFAYQDEQIRQLRDSVRVSRMRGLYFTTTAFFQTHYKPYYAEPCFEPFWDEVEQLSLPVFWVFPNASPLGTFTDEMAYFLRWYEHHEAVTSVIVHGWPLFHFRTQNGLLRLPDVVAELFATFPIYSEVMFPILHGGEMEYPFVEAQGLLRQLYDRCGASRLVWGSDMPNVLRFCTYRQTLDYIRNHCEFLTSEDRDAILGGNALKVLPSE